MLYRKKKIVDIGVLFWKISVYYSQQQGDTMTKTNVNSYIADELAHKVHILLLAYQPTISREE